MGLQTFKPALLIELSTVLLLLLLENTLAIAPGDESDECAVPDYPVNIKVLLDSWRYQTLLPQDGATNSAAMWTIYNTDRSDTMNKWYSTGMCENSTVAVCAGGRGDKWLYIQRINISVPAPDNYPVRVFVNITYSFMTCPEGRDCDHDFELLIARNFGQYTGDGIMPDRHIRDTTASGTQHFYFDVGVDEGGFNLALRSRRKGVCVTVSRVLVYRHECLGRKQQTAGLTRRPATQAPVNDNVSAIPYCVENSHHTGLATDSLTSVAQTPVVTGFITPADLATSRLTSVTQTPVIKASNTPTPTDMSDTESSSEDDGVPTAVFAGVGGVVVVIIALVLLVILLIVILVRKNRNHKDKNGRDVEELANPVYDITAAKTNGSNGTADTHKQEVQNSGVLYSDQFYDDPQYSVPIDSRVPITEYEVPVVPNGSNRPPAHVYDYAAVPHSTTPEYAVLEPQECVYHCLEPPEAIPESNEMAAESDVTGNHYDQPLGQNHEYSSLGLTHS